MQFVLLSATWGSSFVFIKVLDRHWPAVWVALGRVALGAVTLIVLVVLRGERLRVERGAWRHLAIASLLLNVVPFTLFAYGEQHVSSVVAGLWNASAPLWVLIVVMLAFPEEQPTPARTAGLAVGFVGVALLLGPWQGSAEVRRSAISPAPAPQSATGSASRTPGGMSPAAPRAASCWPRVSCCARPCCWRW